MGKEDWRINPAASKSETYLSIASCSGLEKLYNQMEVVPQEGGHCSSHGDDVEAARVHTPYWMPILGRDTEQEP